MAVNLPKSTLLLVVLAGSAAFALVAPAAKKRATPPSATPPAATAEPMRSSEAPTDDTTISGEVLEQIDVAKYSYLRVGEHGSAGTWTAVPATSSKLGQRVRVTSARRMTQFSSATLKRTFDVVYFGMLEGEATTPLAASQPSSGPHAGAGSAADQVRVEGVKRAEGPLGRTIAELYTAKPNHQKVRVRAVVVKQTPGVFGKTFLHVRDGSGRAEDGNNDLAVTTDAEPAVGTQVLLEGTFELDKDFGSGYRYPALLSDAAIIQ
jgi:hypothetical protein